MDTAADSSGRAGNVAERPVLAALLAAARARGLAHLDAELLMCRATGLSRAMTLAAPERLLTDRERQRFEAEVVRRLAGEPLAYIEGHKEFWSLQLAVTPATLVPRPDTELLVERCLAALPTTPQWVADLGTGSGAIAIALAHERPQWSLVATDRSPAALDVARRNALRLGVGNVQLRLGSWLAPLAGEHFDAILSNPPYIAPEDAALAKLTHEPSSALVAADDGFADLLAIIEAAPRHLRPGGLLLLEHGSSQAARLAAALVARGFARVVCHPDLAGLARATEARWP